MPIGYSQENSNSLTNFLDSFVKLLYENKDIGTNHKLNQFIEGTVTQFYINEKAAIHQLVTTRAFLDKENYRVETETKKTQPLDKETLFVTLAVRIRYNYVNLDCAPGPYGTSFSNYVFDERNGYPYSNGDILQHASSSTSWAHTTIITGVYKYYPYSRYYWAPLVCGRTADDWYNYQQKADDFWPGQPKRVITLTGNRE